MTARHGEQEGRCYGRSTSNRHVSRVRQAGYTGSQAVEFVGNVALNLLNHLHVAGRLLDFLVAPSLAVDRQPDVASGHLKMDRANDVWIEELRQPDPRREAALSDLRAGLLRGLRGALAGRAGVDDAFLEDAVQEALLKVLDRLDTFEGRGRFVSWAMAIAVRVALTAIRKKRWQGVSLDRFKEESSSPALDVADHSLRPERAALRSELLAAMDRVIHEHLTDRQWLALTAELNGMPQDEIARQLGSNRNAVYKLTHDARRKLKAGLEAAGFNAESCFEAWER
jgi:RNA polymerase sigma-70 factor, ECF subfamily